MKSVIPHVPDSTLSASIVGIDDFALGFVQTYICENFATEAPNVEQIEAALRALEAYGGYHGLHSQKPASLKTALPTADSIHEEFFRRNAVADVATIDGEETTLKRAL